MQAILTGCDKGDLAGVDMVEESRDFVVGRADLMIFRRLERRNITESEVGLFTIYADAKQGLTY